MKQVHRLGRRLPHGLTAALLLASLLATACSDPPNTAGGPPASKPTAITPMQTPPVSTPIRFAEPALPASVARVLGLDGAEQFGRWSTGKLVVIQFAAPLPPAFSIEFEVGGYGPNVGAMAQVIAGDQVQSFEVERDATAPQTVRLAFQSVSSDFLAVVVPVPTSPATVGKGGDSRKLGLAFYRLTVTPADR